MAVIDSAYQYYLSAYGNTTVSRYDTHKKSQLRDTYNKIIKTNKDSPLYKIQNIRDAQKYAIDIKEGVKNIQHIASELSDNGQGIASVFSKKIAQSSDESIATAEYIGNNNDDNLTFDVEVRQLATGQTNRGNYLVPDRRDFSVGNYSFDLNTDTNSYEFQFSVSKTDTNDSIQQKLMQLINRSQIGISASVEQDEEGRTALCVSSTQTGIEEGEDKLFQILPSTNSSSIHAMKVLGIDQIAQKAQNSVFLLNGGLHSSYTNTITVNNLFDLTLTGVSENGSTATIGFKTDAEAAADNIGRLVSAYNKVIHIGHTRSDLQNPNKLVSDISSVAKDYYNELESMGLKLDVDNYIQIDYNLLSDATSSEDALDNFTILNHFKEALNQKALSASIDPMNYVNKTIVAYKNPGHNFATPYITSIYSGMMLDRYC